MSRYDVDDCNGYTIRMGDLVVPAGADDDCPPAVVEDVQDDWEQRGVVVCLDNGEAVRGYELERIPTYDRRFKDRLKNTENYLKSRQNSAQKSAGLGL